MKDTNTIIRYENAKLIQDRCKKQFRQAGWMPFAKQTGTTVELRGADFKVVCLLAIIFRFKRMATRM